MKYEITTLLVGLISLPKNQNSNNTKFTIIFHSFQCRCSCTYSVSNFNINFTCKNLFVYKPSL